MTPTKIRQAYSDSGAVISPCKRYRYRLWRVWSEWKPLATWVLLNPSTANAYADDPTVRKCVGFARAWGCGGIYIVNLFAWRCTDPAELSIAADPVGPENDAHIAWAAQLSPVLVAGWGAKPYRADSVQALIRTRAPHRVLECLGRTANGQPRHPLYLPYSSRLERL